MSDRFFSSQPITTERVTLDGPEAHHLLHVMRATVGTAVTLFDDSGAEFAAVVETLRRADADVRIVERREVESRAAVRARRSASRSPRAIGRSGSSKS